MLILIDEHTFTQPSSAHVSEAVACALASVRMGYHRLVVSPGAMQAASLSGLSSELVEGLAITQRSWLESQSLLSRISRLIALVDDPSLDGNLNQNRYSVFVGNARRVGIFHHPSLVTESLLADAPLLETYLAVSMGFSAEQLHRNWAVRPDQGGGGTTFLLIDRYGRQPEPMLVTCDRDTSGPHCGGTANKCIERLLAGNHYSSRATAHLGGFSDLRPNLAFNVLRAWSIENFIFPKLMQLFFLHLMNDDVGISRENALLDVFPTYPNLSNKDAELWLNINFKNFPDFGEIFNSKCIERLISWSKLNASNSRLFDIAFHESLSIGPFHSALSLLMRDIWALGVRQHMLS